MVNQFQKCAMLFTGKVAIAFFSLYFMTVFLVSEPLGDAAERYLVKIASPVISNITYHGQPFEFVRDSFFSERQNDTRHKVVTVVVDDGSLQGEKSSFPLSFEQYAHHLELIALRKPKVIFVDLWLHDNRANDTSMTELVDTICQLANPSIESSIRPIKIYLLSFRPFGRSLHPELQKVSKQSVASGEPYCFTEVSAVVPLKEPEQQGWYYPFRTCPNNDCEGIQINACENCIPSAAAAIFNDVLASSPEQKLREDEPGNFQLIWSNRSPDQKQLNAFYSEVYGGQIELDEDCISQKSPLHFLSYFLPDIERISFLSSNQRMCHPFVKLNTYELELARQRIHLNGAGQYVRNQLEDSIVVYGYDLIGINDFVESPIHGPTLGLNFHATAIENLDRIGRGVIRESEYNSFFDDALSKDGLYLIGLSFMGALAHTLLRRQTRVSKPSTESVWLDDLTELVFRILYGIGGATVFAVLLVFFVVLNAMVLRLDYTVLVEGIFFVMALSSLTYVEVLVGLITKPLNRKKEVEHE